MMPLHSHGVSHTALVRWAPGTVFQPHSHPGGEEIFVVDGVFEDEQGRYPAGTWLRNPAWSRHHPFSREGCTLLVRSGTFRNRMRPQPESGAADHETLLRKMHMHLADTRMLAAQHPAMGGAGE